MIYLKKKLQEKHITQKELAIRCNVLHSTINRYCNGKNKKPMPVDLAVNIAFVLNIPINVICQEINPHKQYYINKQKQLCELKEPRLLGLFNKKIRYAYAYCKLHKIYLNKGDASEKKCFQKGKDYCRHLYILEGKEKTQGIKNAKQQKWEGELK